MFVVLRLQGLNIEAGPEDIRTLFHGLQIIKGGVHITGGKTGEAFIIFLTERDGRLAMQKSGSLLKGSPVTLQISSFDEFKQKMKVGIQKSKRKRPSVESEHAAQTPTTELCTALLLGAVAAIQSLQSNNPVSQCQSPPVKLPNSPKKINQLVDQQASQVRKDPVRLQDEESQKGPSNSHSKRGYLRLYGLPSTVTELEVRQFLAGFSVEDVVVNAFHGQDRCCLVEMTSFEEAEKAKRANRSFKDCPVEVRLAHERMWTNAREGRENSPCSSVVGQKRISPGRQPPHSPVKRHRSLSGSPKRCRSESPFGTEYCVMVKNLPTHITKTEIKELFSCPTIPHQKVLHLLNKWKQRTSTAFIIFTHPEEYASAMNMNGSRFNSQIIEVSSITKDKMKDLIHHNRFTEPSTSACSGLSCIYARNFPADVKRADVKGFFCMYDICENDIELLKDKNGNGIGEAVIQFGSEERARKACGLRGELFMGEQILLTCISPQQMKDALNKPQ
ncbi:RNA binding motif protein 12Ba [Trichomycterus rosablanca]|uniref:RNA binding motif protein 12Ba n=1 Tax=Trichomycterus rosablanca TaxID=2290929 RepID=UPI002F350578